MEQETTQVPSDAVGFTEALGEHASNPPNSSTVGDTLVILGTQWKVSADENRIKGQFEMWVRGNARLAISEADTQQLPEEASMMRAAYTADFGAGMYKWDGRHVRNARGDVPGMKQLLYLMLLRCHGPDTKQQITEQIVEDMFDENMPACLMAVMWSLGNFKSSLRRKQIKAAAAARTTQTTPTSNGKVQEPTLDD